MLALFILRWDVGYSIFEWVGSRVTHFLDNASAGSTFLFGPGYMEHRFAFSVCTSVFFTWTFTTWTFRSWIHCFLLSLELFILYSLPSFLFVLLKCAISNLNLQTLYLIDYYLNYMYRSHEYKLLSYPIANFWPLILYDFVIVFENSNYAPLNLDFLISIPFFSRFFPERSSCAYTISASFNWWSCGLGGPYNALWEQLLDNPLMRRGTYFSDRYGKRDTSSYLSYRGDYQYLCSWKIE